MRKALAILAVFSLVSVASADVVEIFYPTRDAAINKGGGETYASGGAVTQCRAMKYRKHFLLMDFDWAGIRSLVDSYPGWSATYELSMVAVAGEDRLNGISARIVISSNDVDWVEGDGTSQFTNFSWTDPDVNPAVTSQFAQTYQDPLDPTTHNAATSIGPWPWYDFDGLRNYANVVTLEVQYNLAPLVFGLGGVRTGVQLDQALMDLIFSGIDATGNYPVRGIYTCDTYGSNSNGEVYTSDAGAALSPYIQVTLVPEPAALTLLGIGGLALIRRRCRM